MTPRETINFFRSRTGAFLLFLLLLAGGYFVARRFQEPRQQTPQGQNEKTERKSQVVETITRAMSVFNPPKEASTPTPSASTPVAEKKDSKGAPELPPISLYAESSEEPFETGPEPLSNDFAPYGRLIPCELVITVDSSSIRTPIVGLITEDVWHHGRLIIPAGTEVHGAAQVDRVRERISSSGRWTLVWQTGEELTLSGLALDREKDADQNKGWGLTDGSAGLRGQLLKSDDLAEIKLFAATFLSGAASGLTDREQTIFGSQAKPSFQNAPLAGAQAVLGVYAQQILDSIQRDGFYVRVPAGKQFYLYVTQTVDKATASIGGTRLAKTSSGQEEDEDRGKAEALLRARQTLLRNESPLPPSPAFIVRPDGNPAALALPVPTTSRLK